MGGGIRDIESITSYIDNGVSRVVLGTQAVKDPEFLEKISLLHPQKIVLAVDFFENQVKTGGWLQESRFTPRKLIERFRDLPLAAIVITDISRDGMMQGINIKLIDKYLSIAEKPTIVGGGLSSYSDLQSLKKIVNSNLEGVIAGKSYYTGAIEIKKAIKILN